MTLLLSQRRNCPTHQHKEYSARRSINPFARSCCCPSCSPPPLFRCWQDPKLRFGSVRGLALALPFSLQNVAHSVREA